MQDFFSVTEKMFVFLI